MICNICYQNKLIKIIDKLRDSNEHIICKCKTCGHIQLFPLPKGYEDRKYLDEDSQVKFLRKVDIDEIREREKYNTARRVDRVISSSIKNDSILDIGSGYGFFIEEMNKYGYNVDGLEISKERLDISKQLVKNNIYDFDISVENKLNKKYDIVTLFHVLEHSLNPVKLCKGIYDILKDNGRLYIEVPNVDEYMLKECNAYNQFYWQRGHINYFNNKTLTSVLKMVGFKEIHIEYVQRWGLLNLCHWISTGRPQLDNVKIKLPEAYEWIDNMYSQSLIENGTTDTLFAVIKKE